MKQFLFVLALLPMVGCTTYANSTYTDKSTKDTRHIEATGAAAVQAAKSNTSQNADVRVEGMKISHNSHQEQIPTSGRYVVFGPDGKRDHRAELRLLQQQKQYKPYGNYGDYTSQQAKRQFDHRMKRKIDDKVQRLMEKIF